MPMLPNDRRPMMPSMPPRSAPMLLCGFLLAAPALSIGMNGCGNGPLWSDLPASGLTQGQTLKLDLDDFVSDSDNADTELTMTISGQSPAQVNAVIDAGTHVLTLTAASTYVGTVTLEVVATDPDGNTASALMPVQVHAARSCQTLFKYDAKLYGPVTSLAVAGEFNTWSTTANPMTDPDGDGVYTSAPLTLAAGYYQYKLVKGGTTWLQDPGNPYHAWLDGFENSEIKVEDCRAPLIELDSLTTNAQGDLDAVFSVTDGSGATGIDANSIVMTAGDAAVIPVWDSFNRVLEVHLRGMPVGKYSLRVGLSTGNGQPAVPLFVPAWLEAKPFTWKDAALYFTFTDRFLDGSTTNNGAIAGVATTANYQGGDFAGIRQKIEDGYFTALGINALWLSPNFDNTNNAEYGDDGRLYSAYHGYWPTSESSVEGHMGTSSELKALIKAAHDRGIRVMFDLVANHVHNQHPYWTKYQASGWFNPYTLCKDNDGWNTNPIGCWFASYTPDLNYKNANALHTLVNDAIRVAKDYDIDGYRVDAVKHLELAYLTNLVADVENQLEHHSAKAQDQFYLVGETFVGEWSGSCSGTSSCSQWLIDSYVGPGLLDGQFDFPLYWQVLKTFARGESNMSTLASILDQSESYYGSDALMSTFLGNHDVARFVSHANGNISDMYGTQAKEQGWTSPPAAPTTAVPYQKLSAAFTFLATIKGIPLVYYGDELGLPGAGDPDNRRMMKFAGLSTLETDALARVKKAFQARVTSEALRQGDRKTLLGSDSAVIVFSRVSANDKVLVGVNSSGTAKTVAVNVASVGFSAGQVLTDMLGGGTTTVSSSTLNLTVPAYGGVIYR